MKYEFEKLISSKSVWIAFILYFLVIGGQFYYSSREQIECDTAIEAVFEQYNSNIADDEKFVDEIVNEANNIMQELAKFGDEIYVIKGRYGENLFQDSIALLTAAEIAKQMYIDFPEHRREVIKQSLRTINAEEEKEYPSNKIISQNELVIEKYNRIIELPFKNVGRIDRMIYYFDNTILDYVMIVLIIMVTVRVILLDVDTGAYQVIYATKKGRQYLLTKEITVVGIIIIFIVGLQVLAELCAGYCFFGITDLNVPIQSYKEFEMCPYLINTGTFLGLEMVCKLFYFICLSSLVIMLCTLLRNSIISMIIASVCALTINILIDSLYMFTISGSASSIDSKYILYELLRTIVPDNLLNIQTYFNKFDYIYIGGWNVFRLVILFVVSAIISVVASIISYIYCGKERRVL